MTLSSSGIHDANGPLDDITKSFEWISQEEQLADFVSLRAASTTPPPPPRHKINKSTDQSHGFEVFYFILCFISSGFW